MDRLSQLYADVDAWMAAYREAQPDDAREDIDIFLDDMVYHAESPYWPQRQSQ